MNIRIAVMGMLLAGPALAGQVDDCRRAMSVRPMQPSPRNGGWGDLYAGQMRDNLARQAAMDLCYSDPWAHLKPLPWEVPVAPGPSGGVCFVQPQAGGGSVVICP